MSPKQYLRSIGKWFTGTKKPSRKTHSRRFKAATLDDITADWKAIATTTNRELRRDLRILRSRSRELAHNDDYMRAFLGLMENNIIGANGITLQMKVRDSKGNLDSEMNKTVEDAFKLWSRCESATASGKMSWSELQAYAVRVMIRDGEWLGRIVNADNAFGFAIDSIDVIWLDENYNQILSNGNRIIMSVEVNTWGKPVAYWLTPPRYDYLAYDPGRARENRERVPAEDIIHLYICDEDEEQTRGIPWAVTAMNRLNQLGAYEYAEVIAARLAACKMGFITQENAAEIDGLPKRRNEDDDEFEDEPDPLLDKVTPGVFQKLAAGEKVSSFDTQHPNGNYGNFISGMLRGAAAGLGISYASLANDLTKVNFSSMKVGRVAERDIFKKGQSFMIEHLCRRVYARWLPNAFLAEQLDGVLARDMKNLQDPGWRPRGWPFPDEFKDSQAKLLQIKGGLTSLTDVLGEQGIDLEELFAKIKEERILAKQYDIQLPILDGVVALAKIKNPGADASTPEPQAATTE